MNQDEIKQSICEVLLSDEFLAAFAAAWYRAKLLGFVTTKWIKQEKAKDGK